MSDLDVRIIKLEPLRVASFQGFGEQPEEQAWQKLAAWAKPRGYLDEGANRRIFGFNNPNPSAGSPNYGYEFWITVGPEAGPEGEMRIAEFTGGLYAVLRVGPIADPAQDIPSGWQSLHTWCEGSKYRFATHQWLEESIGTGPGGPGDWFMDLYMPVAK